MMGLVLVPTRLPVSACKIHPAQIANKPAFEILRTQQQLGYIVFTHKAQHQGVSGLGFIVQSAAK
jgi:secreted Zn-dependent insulinase-like peptidase|eukprot:COSAG01_NODE_141_length_24253_cov_36.101130_10_plen_65_part_00